jgi:hypothetical protein
VKRQVKRSMKRREQAAQHDLERLRRKVESQAELLERLRVDNARLRRIVRAVEISVYPKCSARENGSVCVLPHGHPGEHFSGAARWED